MVARARWLVVVVILAMVAAGVVVGFVRGGVAAESWSQGDGAAWLPTKSGIVLVDGLSGRVAGRVDEVGGAGRLAVTQNGSGAFVVDGGRGAVFRVDGRTLGLAKLGGRGERGLPFKSAERVVAGGGRAYVVQPRAQQVQVVDPTSLAPAGKPVTFTGADFEAQVTGSGRLWLLDRGEGRLQAVDGDTQTVLRPLGWQRHDATMVIVGEAPVLVDRTAVTVERLDGESGEGSPLGGCPWFRSGQAAPVQVAGSTSPRPWLTLANPESGSVSIADLDAESCPSPITVGGPGARYGVPVEAGDRVFLPVISTGHVVVIDPATGRVIADNRVTDPGVEFGLVEENDLVYFAASGVGAVGIVGPDGTVTKVDPGNDGGGDTGGSGTRGAGGGESSGSGQKLICSVDPTTITPGERVTFSASRAGGSAVAATWDFGDGQRGQGNPVGHAFATEGRYTAKVTADFDVASCPEVVVTRDTRSVLDARIGVDRNPVVAGEPVTLVDRSLGTVTARRWTTPGARAVDGRPTDGELTVTYPNPGSVSVTLDVTGNGGRTDRATVTIEVLPASAPRPPQPKAPTPPPTRASASTSTSRAPSPSSSSTSTTRNSRGSAAGPTSTAGPQSQGPTSTVTRPDGSTATSTSVRPSTSTSTTSSTRPTTSTAATTTTTTTTPTCVAPSPTLSVDRTSGVRVGEGINLTVSFGQAANGCTVHGAMLLVTQTPSGGGEPEVRPMLAINEGTVAYTADPAGQYLFTVEVSYQTPTGATANVRTQSWSVVVDRPAGQPVIAVQSVTGANSMGWAHFGAEISVNFAYQIDNPGGGRVTLTTSAGVGNVADLPDTGGAVHNGSIVFTVPWSPGRIDVATVTLDLSAGAHTASTTALAGISFADPPVIIVSTRHDPGRPGTRDCSGDICSTTPGTPAHDVWMLGGMSLAGGGSDLVFERVAFDGTVMDTWISARGGDGSATQIDTGLVRCAGNEPPAWNFRMFDPFTGFVSTSVGANNCFFL